MYLSASEFHLPYRIYSEPIAVKLPYTQRIMLDQGQIDSVG